MSFTLEELKHIMATLNGAWVESNHESIIDCPICSSARKKLEEMIAVATLDEIDKGLPIPEWMAKLGVVKREIVKPGEE